jgi:LmbE family N-acetylglucosaminyl deacetylase
MEFPSISDRVLIFSPHPDDDVLATGGLLQQLALQKIPVRIVFLTDGDNNPWPQRFIERRWKIRDEDRYRWGVRRRREALSALSVLGIESEHAVFLGLPDQGLTALLLHEPSDIMNKVRQEITSWHPTVIIAPAAFDLHPDHSAFAALLKLVMQSIPSGNELPIRVLHFSIHPNMPHAGETISIPLSSQQVAIKKSALLRHDSQMRLSRKRFMSYVKDVENFYVASANSSAGMDRHPVRMTFLEDGYLNLVLDKPKVMERLLGASLLIVAGGSSAFSISLKLGLFSRGRFEIHGPDGSISIGRGEILKVRNSLMIRLPESIFCRLLDVQVKLETKLGFLDRSGWKSFPVVALNAVAEMPYAKIVALIPCYNVAGLCADVIRNALAIADHVIVIDDGSTDGTGGVMAGLKAEHADTLHVISKQVNEGKGSALLDGMQYALEHFRFSALVTLDGDGQHQPQDIPQAVEMILNKRDFVIGKRDFSGMPLRSRFGNSVTSWLFRLLYPKCPSDTQSGFRAFSTTFVREVVACVQHGRYETELYTLLLALSLGVEMDCFQIDTIYLDENRSSHFRPVIDSIRILRSLLSWQLQAFI